MTKQNVIDNVQASMASLFTKEDVIACINSIEQPAPAPATDYLEMLRLTIERVSDMALQFNWDDGDSVDIVDPEFNILYSNQIEIGHYSIDATNLKDNFLYELGNLYKELAEEHRQRTEIVNNNANQ